MPSHAPHQGDFTPERVQRLAPRSNLRSAFLLAPRQEANVAVAFHPFLPVLATAWYGPESHVDLWDHQHGEHLHSLTLLGTGHASEATGLSRLSGENPGGTLPVRDLAMHPDGRLLAVAAGVSVWLLDLGAQARVMREGQELFGHQHGVHALTFSHHGKLLASACDGGQVILWSLATFEPVGSYHLPDGQLRAIAFSADDRLIATGDALGNVSVWDIKSNAQLAFFQAHDNDISDLAFAPHRRLLATAGFDGAVRMWDIDTEQPHGDGLHHGDAVYNIRFSPSGNLLYSCGFDTFVGVWDVNGLDLIDCHRSPAPLLAMDLANDERTLALVTTDSLLTLQNKLPDLSLPDASIRPGMTLHDMLAVKRPAPTPPAPAPLSGRDNNASIPPPDSPFFLTGGLPGAPARETPLRDDAISIPPAAALSNTPIDSLLTKQQASLSGLFDLKHQAPPSPSQRERTLAPTPEPASPRDELIAKDLPTRSLISNAEAGLSSVAAQAQTQNLQALHRSPDFRYDREGAIRQALHVERPQGPNTRLIGAVVAGGLLIALLGGAVGAATAPSGPDPALANQQRAQIQQDAQAARDAEQQRHNPIVAKLQEKLDKVKQGGGNQSVTPLVKALEKSIQEANDDHTQRLAQIDQGAQQQLQQLGHTDAGTDWGRLITFALPAGLLGAIALAFFLKRSGFGED